MDFISGRCYLGGIMFKVDISNYQILSDVHLEFDEGINIIVGESNNGKSAILRAIETALFNLPRESHIQEGKSYTRIGISYNGHNIIYNRDRKSSSQVSYEVDNHLYEKLGRGQPEFIYNLFCIKEDEIGDIKTRLNFQKQMSYPFMLDKTPSQLFKFMLEFSEKDNLSEVLSNMVTDNNKMGVDIKTKEGIKDRIFQDLNSKIVQRDKMSSLNTISNKVINSKDIYDKLVMVTDIINSLEKLNNDIILKGEEMIILGKKDSKLDDLISQIAKLDKISLSIKDTVDKIDRIEADLIKESSSIDLLTKEGKVVESKIVRLESILSSLNSINSSKDTLNNIIENVYNIIDVVKTDKVRIIDFRKELDIIEGKIGNINNKLNEIDRIRGVKSSLDNLISYLTQQIINGNGSKRKQSLIQEDISKIDEELSKFKVCPYCNSKLDGNHNH